MTNLAAPPDPAPILAVEAVTRQFGGLVAVDRVSFTVAAGEIFGLIGPNGAGKTTTFNLITGLIPPTSGDVRLAGVSIAQRRPFEIAALGIARTFQNLRLFGSLTVRENVEVGRYIKGNPSLWSGLWGGLLNLPRSRQSQSRDRRHALDLLACLGLSHCADRSASTLAYGDRRRLEIARALALEPKVLLLDEPAAGMNATEKAALSATIRQIRDDFNLTIVLIEHHVPLVMGLCDRIAVLDFGKRIAIGDPATVRNDPAVIEAYLGDSEC